MEGNLGFDNLRRSTDATQAAMQRADARRLLEEALTISFGCNLGQGRSKSIFFVEIWWAMALVLFALAYEFLHMTLVDSLLAHVHSSRSCQSVLK